jgi:carbamoyl-phosphate synthase large subunit
LYYAEKYDLKYAFGFQFINYKIIECNPRVQGTMVASTLAGANIIEAACLEALGLPVPPFSVRWGASFTRYWGIISDNSIKV